jgi:hypothetical protein
MILTNFIMHYVKMLSCSLRLSGPVKISKYFFIQTHIKRRFAYNTASGDYPYNTASGDYPYNTASGDYPYNTASGDYKLHKPDYELCLMASMLICTYRT